MVHTCVILVACLIDRRSFLLTSVPDPPLVSKMDLMSQWSAQKLVPPPIEKDVAYDELLRMIQEEKSVWSLQPAVQHDIVVATLKNGHRISCSVPDQKLSELYAETFGTVYIEERDPFRANIRSIAQLFLCAYLVRKLVEIYRS